MEGDTGERRTAIGNGQSRGTAIITALTVEALAGHAGGSSVRMATDLLDIEAVRDDLASLGVLVQSQRGVMPTA